MDLQLVVFALRWHWHVELMTLCFFSIMGFIEQKKIILVFILVVDVSKFHGAGAVKFRPKYVRMTGKLDTSSYLAGRT